MTQKTKQCEECEKEIVKRCVCRECYDKLRIEHVYRIVYESRLEKVEKIVKAVLKEFKEKEINSITAKYVNPGEESSLETASKYVSISETNILLNLRRSSQKVVLSIIQMLQIKWGVKIYENL